MKSSAAPKMAERAVWHPSRYAWLLVGLASLALTPEIAPNKLEGHWLFITPCLIVAGVVVVRKLWELPPAVTMCAAIVLTIFSGAWSKMGLGGLPLDRLLIVIVLLMFILRAPGTARVPRLEIKNVHLMLSLVVIYALTSAVAAGTLTTELSILTLIDQLGVVPYLMFLVAPAVFAGRRERNILLATLMGLGAYLGFTAIFASLGAHFLVFPQYIAHVDASTSAGHEYGPFQSSVAEGLATFACAIAAAIAFTQWHGPRKRWIAATVVIVCTFGCFLTLERGVWIAAVVGTVLTALLTRTGRRSIVPGIPACALLVGGLLLLSPALASKTSARANYQLSVWNRENQTTAALRMIQAKPLFGFGWYRYTSDNLPYFRQPRDYPMTGYLASQVSEFVGSSTNSSSASGVLHDTYLSYAVELGLIGMLLWLAALIWGVGGAIFARGSAELLPWKLGLLAIAVFSLIVYAVNPYPAPFSSLLLWVWAGVALGGASLQAQQQRVRTVAHAPVYGALGTA